MNHATWRTILLTSAIGFVGWWLGRHGAAEEGDIPEPQSSAPTHATSEATRSSTEVVERDVLAAHRSSADLVARPAALALRGTGTGRALRSRARVSPLPHRRGDSKHAALARIEAWLDSLDDGAEGLIAGYPEMRTMWERSPEFVGASLDAPGEGSLNLEFLYPLMRAFVFHAEDRREFWIDCIVDLFAWATGERALPPVVEALDEQVLFRLIDGMGWLVVVVPDWCTSKELQAHRARAQRVLAVPEAERTGLAARVAPLAEAAAKAWLRLESAEVAAALADPAIVGAARLDWLAWASEDTLGRERLLDEVVALMPIGDRVLANIIAGLSDLTPAERARLDAALHGELPQLEILRSDFVAQYLLATERTDWQAAAPFFEAALLMGGAAADSAVSWVARYFNHYSGQGPTREWIEAMVKRPEVSESVRDALGRATERAAQAPSGAGGACGACGGGGAACG